MQQGVVTKVSGPLVVAKGLIGSRMYDLVKVGEERLIGEIIEMRSDRVSIQVYEETQGLKPGDVVEPTGAPLSVELGPGMLSSVYDGVQRPLDALEMIAGAFLRRGIDAPGLDREKVWDFVATAKVGEYVQGGDIIGTVQENEVIEHRIMVPPGVEGELISLESGQYTVTDTVGQLRRDDDVVDALLLMQKWPVRIPRPYKEKVSADEPLVTGMRVVDTMFPLAKGGAACVPGPFGAGKTVTQHQIAKWSNARIVVFVCCGERGNEVVDVMNEFAKIKDPFSGYPLMRRTLLVANTSNMPVAAREASVYTGITMAEYFRDMGYDVIMQADSTSRWAEAMREISGRLEEMPGEEGYPAYLGTRIASFYERAGKVVCLGSSEDVSAVGMGLDVGVAADVAGADSNESKARTGSVSVIGSVSPAGGDLSEPVVQNTLRVVKVYWALQDSLAFQRHFPAIDWLTSYSLYMDNLANYWDEHVGIQYRQHRDRVLTILQRESELEEIIRLVGMEALSTAERALMDTAKMLREDFLQQNAFRGADQYSDLQKQDKILEVILTFYDYSLSALAKGAKPSSIVAAPVHEQVSRAKHFSNNDMSVYDDIVMMIKEQLRVVVSPTGVVRCAWEVSSQ